MVLFDPGVDSKSPYANVRMLRAFLLALPLLTAPLLIITQMGSPMPNQYGQTTARTTFNPALLDEGRVMTQAFVVGCSAILLLIRVRLSREAAAWKRHAALYLAYVLTGITYLLLFVRHAAGGSAGGLVYGIGLILFAVTQVSVGRYGYDLSRQR